MQDNTIIWVAVIVILVALIILIISIVVIHNLKDHPDPNKLEVGLIWLYVGTGLVFLAGLMTAIAAELTPEVCRLPYSGQIVPRTNVTNGKVESNVISVPRNTQYARQLSNL